MDALNKLRDFIKSLEDKDFYKYALIFFGTFLLIMGLIFYISYSKTTKYRKLLTQVNEERKKTKKILTDNEYVKQQQEKVEEILAQNKDFRIAKEFGEILQRFGLMTEEEPSRSDGETVGGKIEKILSARLKSITMKQLTELLSAIADVPQLYPKELIIKKTPNAQTVDVELTIATLEHAPTAE